MVGNVYSRLTVISEGPRTRGGERRWKCACECGEFAVVRQSSLKNGHTTSCGCYRLDVLRAKLTKGHDRGSPEYASWNSLRDRCNNVNNSRYFQYGGRGISVCDEWGDFQNFYRDMGDRPSGTSIDRINVDGDYCKENCRWATSTEQANNKTNNVKICFNGETKTIADWARHIGVKYGTLQARLKRGWSVERALTK